MIAQRGTATVVLAEASISSHHPAVICWTSVTATVRNLTRNTVLGDRIEIAETSAARRTGLLKHTGLAAGEGLWIVPCASVHTFFMKFPIDLVYLDRHQRVRKVRHAVGPWKLSACLSARTILELAPGTAQASGTKAGDQLTIERQA
jgi:uncharacterized protein